MFTAKAIIPKPYNNKAVEDSVRERVRKVGLEIKKDFQQTTETWDTKVLFTLLTRMFSDRATFSITTTSDIYRYVTEGTKPHVIRPRRAKMLRFFTGGTPKTQPRVLKPGRGRKATKGPVFAKEVHHPGTEARNYTNRIWLKRHRWVTKQMELAMNWGLMMTGHAWFPAEVRRR